MMITYKPVIAVILYPYTHGSVVAEYNLVSTGLWIYKHKTSQHLAIAL